MWTAALEDLHARYGFTDAWDARDTWRLTTFNTSKLCLKVVTRCLKKKGTHAAWSAWGNQAIAIAKTSANLCTPRGRPVCMVTRPRRPGGRWVPAAVNQAAGALTVTTNPPSRQSLAPAPFCLSTGTRVPLSASNDDAQILSRSLIERQTLNARRDAET